MPSFSPTAGALAASATLAIAAEAKRLRAAGVDVAPFAAGEPDFDTPEHIKEAGIAAISVGRTKYAPAAGIADLRDAVAAQLRGQGLEGLEASDTIVSVGAKGVLYLALTVLLQPGDEVIVPAPGWLSYAKMIQAGGGTTVFVPTEVADGYLVDPERIRAAITPRTRAILINSPGNPTGAVLPAAIQAEIGRIAVEHDLFVISDEIYEHLTYAPATFQSFAAAAPEARDRSLIVNGVSKSYAMTGWRIGYAGGPSEWIQRMVRLQSHAFSGPPEIAQRAALAAITGPQDAVVAMRDAFQSRREVMFERLSAIPDVVVSLPQGAFYMLPDVSAYFGRRHGDTVITDATVLAQLLLSEAHAAVVPGDVFEAPHAVRFSYACGPADIAGGLERVAAFLAQLS